MEPETSATKTEEISPELQAKADKAWDVAFEWVSDYDTPEEADAAVRGAISGFSCAFDFSDPEQRAEFLRVVLGSAAHEITMPPPPEGKEEHPPEIEELFERRQQSLGDMLTDAYDMWAEHESTCPGCGGASCKSANPN